MLVATICLSQVEVNLPWKVRGRGILLGAKEEWEFSDGRVGAAAPNDVNHFRRRKAQVLTDLIFFCRSSAACMSSGEFHPSSIRYL